MKVILNIEAVRFPLTGIGRYTYELGKALQAQPDITQLRFFASGRFVPGLPDMNAGNNADVVGDTTTVRLNAVKRWVQQNPLALRVYQQLSGLLRTNGLKGSEDCIYHGPNFFLPKFAGPKVATFHDLSPFTWAHCHEPAKVQYLQKELSNTLRCADRLITDSEFTRQELAAFSGISADRIHAVPLAAAAEFYPQPAQELQPLLQKYGLTYQGYTLFVGTIEPRKNIATLLQAYEQLPMSVRQRWPLILTGYEGWNSADIHTRMQRAGQQGWCKYLGYLPAHELPGIFSGARLFAFPSHYEGFGLPVLEALSSGVPVVCSNSSSLPEVAGGVALLHTPEDVDALRQYLLQGLEDESWRIQAVTNGLAHAEKFSWQRCAAETVQVYNKLATEF